MMLQNNCKIISLLILSLLIHALFLIKFNELLYASEPNLINGPNINRQLNKGKQLDNSSELERLMNKKHYPQGTNNNTAILKTSGSCFDYLNQSSGLFFEISKTTVLGLIIPIPFSSVILTAVCTPFILHNTIKHNRLWYLMIGLYEDEFKNAYFYANEKMINASKNKQVMNISKEYFKSFYKELKITAQMQRLFSIPSLDEIKNYLKDLDQQGMLCAEKNSLISSSSSFTDLILKILIHFKELEKGEIEMTELTKN